jgi:hypothetical protein
LVEIDKVVVKNYYGCEKNMNINHYWVAILIHIMHSKMASLIAKLRSSTIIVDQFEWNHKLMGQYVYFVLKDHSPLTKFCFHRNEFLLKIFFWLLLLLTIFSPIHHIFFINHFE